MGEQHYKLGFKTVHVLGYFADDFGDFIIHIWIHSHKDSNRMCILLICTAFIYEKNRNSFVLKIT